MAGKMLSFNISTFYLLSRLKQYMAFLDATLCNMFLLCASKVDLDNPDYMKFPLAENLPFLDCILEEGEMLYIPPKWWHYVRSLSLSFSVSFWWSDMDSDWTCLLQMSISSVTSFTNRWCTIHRFMGCVDIVLWSTTALSVMDLNL